MTRTGRALRALTTPIVLSAMGIAALAGCGARTAIVVAAASFDAGVRDRAIDSGPRRDASIVRDAPDAAIACTPGRFVPARANVDIVFVLDRSGSMSLTIDGRERAPREFWRWSLLENALTHAVMDLGPRARVGAAFFPNRFERRRSGVEAPCRTTIGLDVEASSAGTTEMLGVLGSTDPFGGTPTAEAVIEATRALTTSTTAQRFIVLATDGAPNCNEELTTPGCICLGAHSTCEAVGGGTNCLDDNRTVGVIADAYQSARIPVYVVGIEDPLRPDLSEVLDRMADAGGRPRTRPGSRFYSVRSHAELSTALRAVTESISLCTFALDSVPRRDDAISIFVDGAPVPARVDDTLEGWSWADRTRGELTLLGTACERARSPGALVEVFISSCE